MNDEVPPRVWVILYVVAFGLYFGTTSIIAVSLFGLTLAGLRVIGFLFLLSVAALSIAIPVNRALWKGVIAPWVHRVARRHHDDWN